MRRSFYIILNPVAGSRRPGLMDALVLRLEAAGAHVIIDRTKAPGHAAELALAAARRGEVDAIVAAGGDGTINEVARGVVGQGVPLGIIPLGTANVLAIELGLRPRASQVADMLLRGPAALIGTGLVEGRIFLLMVGIGFDGAIVHHINPRLKRLTGKFAFVWSGLKIWVKGPGRPLDLVVDGERKQAQWAVALNGRFFAGSYVLSRMGNIAEPGFKLFLFKSAGRLAFARYLIALALGMVERLSDVEIVTARRVEIIGHAEVEADGDASGVLPQTLEQGSQFLRLIVPQGWKP